MSSKRTGIRSEGYTLLYHEIKSVYGKKKIVYGNTHSNSVKPFSICIEEINCVSASYVSGTLQAQFQRRIV